MKRKKERVWRLYIDCQVPKGWFSLDAVNALRGALDNVHVSPEIAAADPEFRIVGVRSGGDIGELDRVWHTYADFKVPEHWSTLDTAVAVHRAVDNAGANPDFQILAVHIGDGRSVTRDNYLEGESWLDG